ncbi:MAG: threonylcarbamoyl-AMP synthase [Phycisphaerae bacterium]|jgi:L-threonylcarbamoyladenylate synthase|nr:threonylcarbamoyl-AMP synthase [Phycisphaerae bacterium]
MAILLPSNENITKASKMLQNGDLVAFATETVYGLGCDTYNKEAIHKVYETKGRPPHNPMIAHIIDIDAAKKLTPNWCNRCTKLADEFWPGPLTIVVQKEKNIPISACGGRETIAIRCPAHKVARELLFIFGGPISAPSANRSGYVSPTTAKHVESEFGDDLTILDGGPCINGIESTVLSLLNKPTILRPGTITQAQIETVVGEVVLDISMTQSNSPGTSKSHYSPSTKTLLSLSEDIESQSDSSSVAITLYCNPKITQIKMPTQPKEYAQKIYSALREADNSGARVIYIEIPPNTPEWFAVNDRLTRCASG